LPGPLVDFSGLFHVCRPRFVLIALLALTSLQGCATQLVAVGDWGRTPDLHLAEDTLKEVRIKVTCHRLDNRHGRLLPRRYGLCGTLQRQMTTLGATIVDADDETQTETPADYTLQYVDIGSQSEGVSAVSLVAGFMTGWLIPYVSTQDVHAEFRILDARGVQIDSAPMMITHVGLFGWGALAALRSNSLAEQQSRISRQFFMLAKNRMASHVRATKWAQP
jgi:hypothetical protein